MTTSMQAKKLTCMAVIRKTPVSINRVTWSSYPFPKIASKRTPSATIIPGIAKIMSVSFIGELNEIVIFRPATGHPEPITFIKVTKVNYFWLGHSTKHPGQAFQTITSG